MTPGEQLLVSHAVSFTCHLNDPLGPCELAARDCSKIGLLRVTWPGSSEKVVCGECGARLRMLADTMGFALPIQVASRAAQLVILDLVAAEHAKKMLEREVASRNTDDV